MVTGIRKQDAAWFVEQEGAPPREADAVVVATGGLSIPKSGSDGVGLEILRGLGHTIRPTYPALTPLTGAPPDFRALAGISLAVAITARTEERSAEAQGGFLFTHHGYSGPSVLDVSHVAVRSLDEKAPARVTVRWTKPGRKEWEAALRGGGGRTVGSVLRGELPDRLAAALCAASGADPATPLARLTRDARLALVETLSAGALPWSGHGGYAKAEVTGGGVALEEIHPATMESRLHRGLFLCGEALDAFGPIGGYNFLWAWATGRAAGISAAHQPDSE
jgi:predicted Rossmann fold flavoprotein